MPQPKRPKSRKNVGIVEHDVERVTIGKPLIQIAGRTQLYHGRLHLKPENFPGLRTKSQRVLLKRLDSLEEAREQVDIADMLRLAGLPVPKIGMVCVRNPKTHVNEYYLAIEPFLRQGRSIIVPINPEKGKAEPMSMHILRVHNPDDKRLIISLAEDLAMMYNLKIHPKALDFWGLHYTRKGRSLNKRLTRVIFDLGELIHYPHLPDERLIEFSKDSLKKAKTFLGKEEYELFESVFKRHLRLKKRIF